MTAPDLRAVAVAGHTGDTPTARAGLASRDPAVRAAALGALERLGSLDDPTLTDSLRDGDSAVRRRAAEIAAQHPSVDLLACLHDSDDRVVEVAAWACGEHEARRDDIIERLVDLAGSASDPLVRESAVATLGAIGDERGCAAIIAACSDKPPRTSAAPNPDAPTPPHPDHHVCAAIPVTRPTRNATQTGVGRAVRGCSGRRSSRGVRSRCADTDGWRLRATVDW